MRDETPDVGVELGGIKRRGTDDEDAHYVLEAKVPTPNPQSDSRDSHASDDTLVGEIPVTNADLPCADKRLNAEFVTALEEEVRAYYPFDDSWVVVLTWDAATDEWDCDRRELETYSFDPDDVRLYDEEAVLWRRVNDETVLE